MSAADFNTMVILVLLAFIALGSLAYFTDKWTKRHRHNRYVRRPDTRAREAWKAHVQQGHRF